MGLIICTKVKRRDWGIGRTFGTAATIDTVDCRHFL
jgi:hypothetical protein